MKRIMFARLGLAIALALAFGARSASADTYSSGTWYLQQFNISSIQTDYVKVDVNLDVTTQVATFTFTAATPYLLTDGSSAAANINSDNFSVSALSGTSGGYTGQVSPSLTATTYLPGVNTTVPPTVDGWGRYNLVVDNSDSWSYSARSITFQVTNNDSTKFMWNSFSDVTSTSSPGGYGTHGTTTYTNGAGEFLAAHIGVVNSTKTAFLSTNGTGYVSVASPTPHPPSPVPEPSALAIAGLGGLGLIGYGLRRRRAK